MDLIYHVEDCLTNKKKYDISYIDKVYNIENK